MNRRKFIKICQVLGLTLPLQPLLNAKGSNKNHKVGNDKSVIIVGAGAAGLVAGYLLQQQGIDFEILEASSNHGGRMKRTTEFADFPIPLGAEWLHVEPDILKQVVNNDSIDIDIKTTKYNPEVDYALYEGEEVSLYDAEMTDYSKFIDATWFDFFERYVVPSVEKNINYNAVVNTIDYSSEKIRVIASGITYSADRVIVTAPVKVLQNGMINFIPALPKDKQKAINKVTVWDGCKAFIEFSEKFYPALVGFEVNPSSAGEKLYYDASYGQHSMRHILGLFAVGSAASPYITLSDDDLIKYILNELDELSGGQASEKYIKHIFQNWNQEPFINGAYVMDGENWRLVNKLGKSVDERVYFAGEAYTEGKDWGSVHAAVHSAQRAVDSILDA